MSSPRQRSSSPSSSPELRPRRTVEMYERLEGLELDELGEDELKTGDISQVTIDGEPYLRIDNVNYRIMDSTVTNFADKNKPIVQISSASGTREIIILDPSSQFLNDMYERFKKMLYADLHNKLNTKNVLEYTMDTVRQLLLPYEETNTGVRQGSRTQLVEQFVEEKKGSPEIQAYHGAPIISMDSFIRGNAGVCRHHALLNFYLLDKLIQDGILPEGRVFYQRDLVASEGAHTWAMYKPTQASAGADDHYNFYLVDSMWRGEAVNVIDEISAAGPRLKGYGKAAIDHCVSCYDKSDLESVSYTSLSSKDLKEDFIYAILEAPTKEERRKLLNHQYSLGAGEAIRDALKSYSKHKNHKFVLADIERVLKTETLHNEHYYNIDVDADRQQFVLALLCKSEDELNSVLDKQDEDDLQALKKSLMTDSTDRKDLYQKFDAYNPLLGELTKRIEMINLHKQHYDEIEDHPDRERFMIGLLNLKEVKEARSSILDRQNLADLVHMKRSLENHPDDLYRKGFSEKYQALLDDIEQHKIMKSPYYYLNSSDTKKFDLELLECKSEDRRSSILNGQDIDDLKRLQKHLTKNTTYKKYELYKDILSDVNKCLEVKELLHSHQFNSLKVEDRRLFRSELFKCSSEERNVILKKQSPKALEILQKSLLKHSEYQSGLEEVNKVIALKLLDEIMKIIVSGKLGLPSWKPNFLADKIGTIPVPKSAKKIFDLINEVKLESANVSQLTKLINDIRASANESASHSHEDHTQMFLDILKKGATPISLLTQLKEFQLEEKSPQKQHTSTKLHFGS